MNEARIRHATREEAIKTILEGADKAFAEIGVAKAGMNEIASAAGMSRGTLYQYFENRHALHLAYVRKVAAEILEVKRQYDPDPTDPVESILITLREVRKRPGALAWFAPGEPIRMGRAQEIQQVMLDGLLLDEPQSPFEDARRKWLIRLTVSFLADPEESTEDEARLLRRFASPGLAPDELDDRALD